MFHKKGYLIVSDEGFSLDMGSPWYIYKEGEKTLKAGYERLNGKFPICVYLGFLNGNRRLKMRR